MKRVTNLALFKGFFVWCMLFSLATVRLSVLLDQFDLLRFAHFLLNPNWKFTCWLYLRRSMACDIFMANEQNHWKTELNSFRICFSLSSYLYFLVTKKSFRLQVHMVGLIWMILMMDLHKIDLSISLLPTCFPTDLRHASWLQCCHFLSTADVEFARIFSHFSD